MEAAGFVKQGSSDSYVLLGGGSHKLLSDFSMSHNHPYLPLAGGTLTGTLIIKPDSKYTYYNEGLRLIRGSNNWTSIIWGADDQESGAPSNGWFSGINPSNQFIIAPYNS